MAYTWLGNVRVPLRANCHMSSTAKLPRLHLINSQHSHIFTQLGCSSVLPLNGYTIHAHIHSCCRNWMLLKLTEPKAQALGDLLRQGEILFTFLPSNMGLYWLITWSEIYLFPRIHKKNWKQNGIWQGFLDFFECIPELSLHKFKCLKSLWKNYIYIWYHGRK